MGGGPRGEPSHSWVRKKSGPWQPVFAEYFLSIVVPWLSLRSDHHARALPWACLMVGKMITANW